MVIYTWSNDGDVWWSTVPEQDIHGAPCVFVSRWHGVTLAWSATSLTHTCNSVDDGMRVAFGEP